MTLSRVTARPVLRIEDLTLAPGVDDLLVGASWHLRAGARVGLVGRNGTGKSTLLKALAEVQPPSDGRIHRRGDVRIGYLPQQAVSGSTAPVWDEARSQMAWLQSLEADLRRAEDAVAADPGDPTAAERLARVTERMRLRGAFQAEEAIGEVLHGLGFSPEDWQRPCDSFSGGWQMRIALARLLLSRPNVLLLDEPTNHLDISARSWLSDFLLRYPATLGEDCAMVLVSHDRHLLDAVCTEIVEIRGQGLDGFRGNLSAWIDERERRDSALETTRARQDKEIAKLERFVERFGAKANKAAQARSKQKALDRIERVDGPLRESRPRLHLPDPPAGSLEAVVLRGAALGWPDGPTVLSGVDLVLERGMRLAVLGPNGCGKSTLMAGISGDLPLREGRRVPGRDLRIGRYAQDLAQALPAAERGLDAVAELAPLAPELRIRKALGALGLVGEAQLRPVAQLSGGEKARLVLAALVCRPANVLLLDEPSNHLDAVTVEVLADALAEWEGTVVLVSHDRWLVERVATHVAHVEGGGVSVHAGVRPDDFLPPSRRTGSDGAARSRESSTGAGKDDWQARKAAQRERQRIEKRLAQVHDEVEVAEAAVADVDHRLAEAAAALGTGGDPDAFTRLSQEREAAQARLDACYAEWESLEEALEATPDEA